MRKITVLILTALILMTFGARADDSLWGKSIRAEMVSPPSDAFDAALEAPFVAGISADGQKYLIVGFGGAPYLWDQGSGARLFIVPGSDYVDEALNLTKESALAKHAEDRERLEAMYADANGDPRLALLMDQSLRLAPGMVVQGACGDYMGLSCTPMILSGLLDCRDGKWYCPERGTPTLPVIDGKSVVQHAAEAKLWNVASGETADIDFGLPGWAVLCARCLPDGSICGVLQDRSTIDKQNGQTTVMVVLPANGNREEYALGMHRMGRGFDTLMTSGDGRGVVAFSVQTIQVDRPFYIDRNSGEVSLLTRQLEAMRPIPLADCLNESGAPVLSETDATCAWYPVAEMKDGTLLAMDLSRGELFLIDPGSLKIHVLIDDAGFSALSEYRMALLATPVPFSGNGTDIFPLRRQDKYLHLAE